MWIAFTVMAVFSVLFGIFSERFSDEGEPTPASRLLQGFALLAPTVVLVNFGMSTKLEVPLAPTAGFLGVLLLGVGFIHRKAARSEEALLSLAVGAGTRLTEAEAIQSRGWTLPTNGHLRGA